jgi:hypothetical protein
MNRRQFLERLLAGAAGTALAATLDVDQLLWTPGAKTIFLPPTERLVGPWLARGDVFTIEGYYAFSEKTHQRLPFLKEFVATEDFTPTERDIDTGIRIYPRIVEQGPYQNTARVGACSGRLFHQLHGSVGVVASEP